MQKEKKMLHNVKRRKIKKNLQMKKDGEKPYHSYWYEILWKPSL